MKNTVRCWETNGTALIQKQSFLGTAYLNWSLKYAVPSAFCHIIWQKATAVYVWVIRAGSNLTAVFYCLVPPSSSLLLILFSCWPVIFEIEIITRSALWKKICFGQFLSSLGSFFRLSFCRFTVCFTAGFSTLANGFLVFFALCVWHILPIYILAISLQIWPRLGGAMLTGGRFATA